ncbi:hypothetical protein RvY_09637 [Ramazzottius varieornatus]|uniref:Uncharacterized protein n=1 Tax=Ramazzottius varieornatus TaxID=947166 RepID=A0A1D1VA31_RAMVA|nr:hypothetical protein RvY_09637 [Ramazzottius varieornatus]
MGMTASRQQVGIVMSNHVMSVTPSEVIADVRVPFLTGHTSTREPGNGPSGGIGRSTGK